MKRYIRAATLKVDKAALIDSIRYLFDEAANLAGVADEDVSINKISVEKDTDGPRILYFAKVEYSYQNKSDSILLFWIPTNQNIPEDFWVDRAQSTTPHRTYAEYLARCFDTSKVEYAKEAYDEFCDAATRIGNNYGLTVECRVYPEFGSIRLSSSGMTFYVKIVDADLSDPYITYTPDNFRHAILTDTSSGNTISIYGSEFDVHYDFESNKIYAYDEKQNHDVESIISNYIEKFMSDIQTGVAKLQQSSEYLAKLDNIASLLESVPDIVVKPNDSIKPNPKGIFQIQYKDTRLNPIIVENVFEVDEKKLLKNLKARVRRHGSSSNNDQYATRSETIFTR